MYKTVNKNATVAPTHVRKNWMKLVCASLALVLVFGACKKNDVKLDEKGNNKGQSTIVWNGQSDRDVAANIDAVQNDTRKNASGVKITSNAHSADFPGIYFIWDSKQKDNGYLKVDANVFNNYVCFTLTSKESNTYWDFVIVPQIGQQLTADNCYVFYIPKVYNNKNINMVFISETRERTDPNNPPMIVNPPVTEKQGSVTKYVIVSSPTQQAGAIVDIDNQWHCGGMSDDIKTHWSNTIRNAYPTAWTEMTSIQTKDGVNANWIWDREDSWEYGISGSQYLLYVSEFQIDGKILQTEIPFYFACDNAAVIFVNGQRVAYTTYALANKFVPSYGQTFNGCSHADFDGTVWQHLYQVDIKPYLKQGYNVIKVLAANSDDNGGIYNRTNNPAGLIFASQFSTFKKAQ